MNNISAIQSEIISNFKLFEEWDDKYEYLLEFSTNVDSLNENEKLDTHLVQGCQSRVWLLSEFREGKVWFKSDGDAPIPKGIAAALTNILSGHEPEQIVKAEVNFHKETGLVLYLSPARVKGIESMIVRFRSLAAKYLK